MKRLEREIEDLKKKILALGTIVEEGLRDSVRAIRERDAKLAAKIIAADSAVDHMEVDVEEECLKLLALHQPVAIDLRYIVAVIKLNNDLERIADLSVNIAERAVVLSSHVPVEIPPILPDMAGKVQIMLKKSLDSLVNMDVALAREVCASDDEVDGLHRRMYAETQNRVLSKPDHIDVLFNVLSVSRYLERVADHATNIAEDVIYLVEGEIIRHGAKKQE
jgi:phosphate transport system protein